MLARALAHAFALACALGLPAQSAQALAPQVTPQASAQVGAQNPQVVPPAATAPAAQTAAPQASAIDDAKYDSDAALPAHADSVVTYEIHASLDPQKHTVHGEGTLQWRNTSNVPVHEIWMHLYLNAFKNQR